MGGGIGRIMRECYNNCTKSVLKIWMTVRKEDREKGGREREGENELGKVNLWMVNPRL